MISFEWITGILVLAIFALIGLIYKTLSSRVEDESTANKTAHSAMWLEINNVKKENATIEGIKANLQNIERRLSEVPTHKDLYDQFTIRDDKLERKLEVIIQQDHKFDAIFTLLTKDHHT